jgi:hypothetical protein
MNKKHFLMVVIATNLLVFTACKDNKSTKETPVKPAKEEVKKSSSSTGSGEISIITPEGFTRIDTTTMGQKAIFLMSEPEGPSDMFKENLNVLSERVGSMSLQSYMDLTEGNMGKMLQSYIKKDLKDITVDGTPAKSLDYTHNMSGYELAVNAVVVIKNERAYIITSTAKAGEMSKWRKKFEEAINSFHVD